jgi:hypothetical protein
MAASRGLIAISLLALLSTAACGGGGGGNSSADDQEEPAPEVTGSGKVPAIPAAAPAGPALAEADSQNGDFRLSITEASRSNGVLTLKARVTLLGGQTGNRTLLYESDSRELYVVAGDQKYMILKDNENDPLTTADGYSPTFRQLGGTNMWWGKFPAPPPEVKSVAFYFKNFLPVENIPITDR